jgi:hypothetical protein
MLLIVRDVLTGSSVTSATHMSRADSRRDGVWAFGAVIVRPFLIRTVWAEMIS